MKWFRFYTEALHDPKVQRLSPPLFKTWVNLLCLANDQEDRGNLPPTEDIAFALRLPLARTISELHALIAAGLLDVDGEHVRPHGWNKRQPASDNAAERMANSRRTSSEQVRPREDKRRSEEKKREKKTQRKRKIRARSRKSAAASVPRGSRRVVRRWRWR